MRDGVLRDLLGWLPVGSIPYGNGILRMAGYGPVLGEPLASVVSTACDVVLVLCWAGWFGRRWPGSPLRRGCVWLAATTGMHFVGNSLLFGMTWAQLAAKYRIQDGELWSIVSLAVWLSPWLARPRSRA